MVKSKIDASQSSDPKRFFRGHLPDILEKGVERDVLIDFKLQNH